MEFRSLEDLLDLQAVDLEIDRLLYQRQNLPALEQYKVAAAEVAQLDVLITDVTGRIRENDLAVDRAEGELTITEIKLEQEERRLYAGGLSARDAEHLRAEVDMLRRRISQREDEILALIDERELQDAEAADLDGRRSVASTTQGGLENEIATAWKAIDGDIARAEVRKADIIPLIPAELLETYEQLRPIKEGVAIGRLADDQCGGCHLRLTAAEQSQVAKSDPPRCPHCRRLLAP